MNPTSAYLTSALAVVLALSTGAHADDKGPAFSIVCQTPAPAAPAPAADAAPAPTVKFAGSAVQKGHVFKSWDFKGLLSVQRPATGTDAASTDQFELEAPNLQTNNIGLTMRTIPDPNDTPGLEGIMTLWLPDGIGMMPAGPLEFTTEPNGYTNLSIVDANNPQTTIYSDSKAQLQCAWTRTKVVKDGFWGSVLSGFANVGFDVLFPGVGGN